MRQIGDHAVVLGAGVGGLLAARVLADAYERVTLVERDTLPGGAEHRRGVPQARHVHALLPRGSQILEELFPGILQELVAGGVPLLDNFTSLHFSVAGHVLCPKPVADEPVYQPSRPYLEAALRARVRAMPGLVFADGCDVVGLAAPDARDRVTGARVMRRADSSAEEILHADLVVDAMGRGARTPAWLERLGYDRVLEERLPVGVKYSSRPVRLQPGAIPEKQVIIGARPGRPSGMALIANENDSWIFTVSGYGERLPSDAAGMVEHIAGFAPHHVVEALRDAEPLGEVVTHRFPAALRRRYEKIRRFPAGLLVFGDAICSFNPIYGQGMSVAALQALALRDCLRRGERDLARRFFRAAASSIAVAWRLATSADVAVVDVKKAQPVSTRLVNAYVGRFQAAAERDTDLAVRFMRVSALLEPPSLLFRPTAVARVLTGNLHGRRRALVARGTGAHEAVEVTR
ncbi:FAD-dependent oxidoreductase [Phytoactinopolyspora alkaliphila]|uniref:FAD-dependent oxidoreductase n=1 Tax=Phytoactinopolyspora alkaliphila TaxID=1783498 RepID=UPI001C20568F|nr:NAD(P)-binding protein [Phytoactinopolyspora alkaliphila]